MVVEVRQGRRGRRKGGIKIEANRDVDKNRWSGGHGGVYRYIRSHHRENKP